MFYKKRIELLEKKVDMLIESRLELFRENMKLAERINKLKKDNKLK